MDESTERRNKIPYASHCSTDFNNIYFPYFALQMKSADAKKKYLFAIDSLCEYVGKDFLEIEGDEALDYYRKLLSGNIRRKKKKADLPAEDAKPLSRRTVYMRFSCVRSFATFLQANQERFGITYESPFTFLQLESTRPSDFVSPETVLKKSEIDLLFDSIHDKQTYLIVALVLKCGLSVRQIITLTPQSLVLDQKDRLAIRSTKGKQEHVIKVPEELVYPLLTYAENRIGGNHLFVNKYNEPLAERTLQRHFQKLAEDAGLSGWTLQDLRKTSACYMLGAGFTRNEVATHLGVRERWMYRYDRVVEELERQPSDYGLLIAKYRNEEA